MKNSQSFRTHGRSAYFIILVFIFVILFYFFSYRSKNMLNFLKVLCQFLLISSRIGVVWLHTCSMTSGFSNHCLSA